MTSSFTPGSLQSVQDRVQSLAKFIAANVAEGSEVTLIARSIDSPVVQACDAAADALAAANASVRAVFLQSNVGSWAEAPAGDGFARDIRLALNPRLLEAHEQLVIAPRAVWIGDCMRRDPSKRDAFSQEKVGCTVTATFAALSFEKLWQIGTPRVPALSALGSVPAIQQGREIIG
jgi:hypothetical protein